MQLNYKSKIFEKSKSIQGFTVPLLFVVTFLLVLFNKTDYFLVSKIKSSSLDIITPVSRAITYPIKITAKTINYVNDLRLIKYENIINTTNKGVSRTVFENDNKRIIRTKNKLPFEL